MFHPLRIHAGKLLAAGVLLVFGLFVWPTPYRYLTWRAEDIAWPVRVSRLTGRAELLSRIGWLPMAPEPIAKRSAIPPARDILGEIEASLEERTRERIDSAIKARQARP
ncbi:MAG: hypothetical protein ACYC3F_05245 [Gemmatimonadaceae bacterium]